MKSKTIRPHVGIGTPVEFCGVRWLVSAITKKQLVLTAVGNPSRKTTVDHGFVEKVLFSK